MAIVAREAIASNPRGDREARRPPRVLRYTPCASTPDRAPGHHRHSHRGEHAMRHGVVFPQTEFGNDVQAIKDYAQTAEGLGYDYLLVYDHVLGAHPNREPKLTGPYTDQHPFHEP